MREQPSDLLSEIKHGTLPSKWRLVSLKSLVIEASYGLNNPSNEVGNTSILGMKNIRDGHLDLKNVSRVMATQAEREASRLRRGNLLINRTNSLDLVGKVAMVERDLDHVFASYLVRLVLDERQIDPWFLCFWLNSRSTQRLIRRLATAAVGQANLNISEFQKHCLVPLPSLRLQHHIGAILRAWDEAIEKTERLVATKHDLRNHLRRTHIAWDKWPLRAIGEVVSPISRPQPTPTTAYTALGIRSHGKGTFQRQIDRPEEIDMDTVYVVGERDLIVNITFAWEGAIALAKPEDAGRFVSHRFPTFEIDEKQVNRNYLGYAVRAPRFIRELGTASPGGAGRNRVLKKSDFLKIKIPFPPKNRQDLIAKVLDSADREIALLSGQRDALVKQKRGLMQKLLTGEWPVSAPKSREAAE